jgi:hypothetical protein
MKSPCSKFLVYTSAGDNSNLHYWLKNFSNQKCNNNFELWITYYGDEEEDRYLKLSDFYNRRKGGKFPNFYYVYHHWKDILCHYEAIFLLDDDIIIDSRGINKLFKIREQYDLWLLQPAFDPRGKISHPITKMNRACFMRYTNFVEVGCALFRKDKLDDFMKVYDPSLTSWGVDFWFLHTLGESQSRIAIIDAVPCINPLDNMKHGGREIERLEKTSVSVSKWVEIKERFNIQFDGESGKFQMKQFGFVKNQQPKK